MFAGRINRSVFSLRFCGPPCKYEAELFRSGGSHDVWILTLLCSVPPPHRACLLMEQGGSAEGGPESPQPQDGAGPQDREDSPASGGPPESKTSHAEVNGSPANAPRRLNGSPLRPLGGVNK